MLGALLSGITFDMNSFISNVGFPIMMCLLMYKLATDTIERVNTAIQNLTVVITQLVEKLDDKREE